MAEIDTGLGWSAQDSYLKQTTGPMGNVQILTGGSDYPDQPTSYQTTAEGIVANGIYMGHGDYDYWASAATDAAPVFVFGLADTTAFSYAASPVSGTIAVYAGKNMDTGMTFINTYCIATHNQYTNSSGITLYWEKSSQGYNPNTPGFNLPIFQTVEDALDAITATLFAITKSNVGYAVACFAKWKTSAGATIATPILISSDSSFTDMEEGTGQYNLAKLNVLRQGMRFYMSFFDIASTGATFASGLPTVDLSGDGARSLEQVFATIADLDHAAILVLNSPDPYEDEGGGSGEEGGNGEDIDDDPVEEETLPVPSVAGHGFCTIYVPSTQELGQMASYLWGGSFDVSQVIKLFSNPMDSILGLSAVPVSLTGSPEQIYLGGVPLTGITMPKYTGRTSVKVDFGTVTVAERWGSYMDYAPYTDFSIYLPFIGIKSIKADDIMGKTVGLMYAIDILSGGCVAYLRPAGGSVLYEWSGQCALQIPVTGRNYDNVFQSAMSVATAAVAAVAAPASAPVLAGTVASAAVQAAATKPHIERSGTVNGITGFLGQLRPYLIRTIPEAYIPSEQNKFIGYPAYINVDLATVQGYNEVDSIHLENVTATGAELDEIESILKGGVIF